MMSKFNLKLGFQVFIMLLVFYGLHFGFTKVLGIDGEWKGLGLTLELLYAFNFLFTVIIFGALIGIHYAMPQSLGYVFLGLITVRAIASYLFVDNAVNISTSGDFLRYNFLLSFLVFLMMDAFVAYRLLNK